MSTRRTIRFLIATFCSAADAGARGSHNISERMACAWVLAVAPLPVPLELRRAALEDLNFLTAMTGRPRPLARCGRRRPQMQGVNHDRETA
jgi:hypothetical protein